LKNRDTRMGWNRLHGRYILYFQSTGNFPSWTSNVETTSAVHQLLNNTCGPWAFVIRASNTARRNAVCTGHKAVAARGPSSWGIDVCAMSCRPPGSPRHNRPLCPSDRRIVVAVSADLSPARTDAATTPRPAIGPRSSVRSSNTAFIEEFSHVPAEGRATIPRWRIKTVSKPYPLQ
jgi:hypothetical protein